jgi:hypothetical protein
MMGRSLRAERSYHAFEPVLTIESALWTPVSSGSCCCDGGGVVEHRVDAAELRNEAAFINDFRDDVADPAAVSRRRANVIVTTVVANGTVHGIISTTEAVGQGRELLLDYGGAYWKGQAVETQTSLEPPPVIVTGGSAQPEPEPAAPSSRAAARRQQEAALRELEAHQPLERDTVHLHASTAHDGHPGWNWIEWPDAWQALAVLDIHDGVTNSLAALLPGENISADRCVRFRLWGKAMFPCRRKRTSDQMMRTSQ